MKKQISKFIFSILFIAAGPMNKKVSALWLRILASVIAITLFAGGGGYTLIKRALVTAYYDSHTGNFDVVDCSYTDYRWGPDGIRLIFLLEVKKNNGSTITMLGHWYSWPNNKVEFTGIKD